MSRTRESSIVIEADPTTVFDVLADPTQHRLFDGSSTIRGTTSAPPRLYLGATFSMRMRRGAPYVIKNRVIEWDEDRLIAWRHVARHIWRYRLEPVQGHLGEATKVTETFDYSMAPAAFAYAWLGFPESNAAAIEASLQQLKTLIESRVRTSGHGRSASG